MKDTAIFDREYRTTDKTGWAAGAWQDEPDKAQWVDAATGLDCLIVRNPGGALCGYVGLPPQHPWHGKGYSECLMRDCTDEFCYEHSPDGRARVHGGLTFSAACSTGGDESRGICHVPLAGRPHDVWWFGFDCAHSGDLMPSYDHLYPQPSAVYRDVEYVRGQCADLARQLAAVAS